MKMSRTPTQTCHAMATITEKVRTFIHWAEKMPAHRS